MLIRLFLGACIAAVACGPALADGASGDPDRPLVVGSAPNSKPAANNDSPWMDLGYPVKAERTRRATRVDVERLKKLQLRPAVKCTRIEYVHQCLSSQNMTLVRARCRAGSTEASCCQAARNYVNSKICGPIWDRLKKAGKTYYPGIWLCKCVETARVRRELRPRRPE